MLYLLKINQADDLLFQNTENKLEMVNAQIVLILIQLYLNYLSNYNFHSNENIKIKSQCVVILKNYIGIVLVLKF